MTTRLTATGDIDLGINGSAIWQRETGTTGGLWHSIDEYMESVDLSTFIDLYSFGTIGPFIPPGKTGADPANMFKCSIGSVPDFPGNAVVRIYVGSSIGNTEFYFGNLRISYFREFGGNPLNLAEQDPAFSVNPYIQITNSDPHILEVPLLITSPWYYKPDVIDKNLSLLFETSRYPDGTGLASNARIYAVDVTFGEMVFRYVSGGAVVGGTSAPSYASNINGKGGALVGGNAQVPYYIYEVGHSGALVGGIARVPTKYDEVGVGGAVVGGSFLGGKLYLEIGSGGALVGGTANDFNYGGVLLGGIALVEVPFYQYVPTTSLITTGGNSNLVINYKYDSTGEVIVGGVHDNLAFYHYVSTGLSDDAPPDYAGVTVGYQNSLNPTIVKLKYNLYLDFKWNCNAFLSKDYSFQWNTGRIRQYWYRIVGKGKQDTCPPVQVTNCCMKYIMNIHAQSIDDLCKKLTQQQWQWPISSVQKFSRPLESADIKVDAANGITYNCNIAEEVEVCNNQLCAQFCIDFDLVDFWGAYSIAIRNKDISVIISGDEIVLGGNSDTSFIVIGNDFFATSNDGINVSGDAFTISSCYSFVSSGEIDVSGHGEITSSKWKFSGGDWPLSTKLTGGKIFSQFAIDDHSQSWSLINQVMNSDNSYSSVDVSFGRSSYFLVVENFGISIPEGSQILGVVVKIERRATSSVRDSEVYLVIDEQILSNNLAKATNWPIGIDGTATYGGVFNPWNSSSWTLDQINNPNFGVAIKVQPVTIGAGIVGRIDFVGLQVFYQDADNQYIHIGGEAKVKSSRYKYTGTGSVILSENDLELSVNRRFVSIGHGSIGPNFSSINVGGQYAKGYHYISDGGNIIVEGNSIRKSSMWITESTDGINISGESLVKSQNYIWIALGEVYLSGNNNTNTKYRYSSNSGINISGESDIKSELFILMDGGLITGGEALVRSSAQSWESQGGLIIYGEALARYSDHGIQESFAGAYAIVQDLIMIFDTTNVENSTLVAPETTINSCGCTAISLSLQFIHNTFTNNILEQFLLRNNIVLPRINLLNYNKINNSWQCNFRWSGKSTNTGQPEIWTVVLDLLCTNLIAGESIGINIWKFTMGIRQKNLTTLEDFDTKIVVAFVPDQICKSSNFKFDINFDTSMLFASINPISAVYQSVLYDNIGLFKTEYWLNNPTLQFTISQVGINNPIPRQQLNIG